MKTKHIIVLVIASVSCLVLAAENDLNKLADKNELYTGKEFFKAFVNPVDNPKRPNVLLIGDSISIGYTVEVRKLLKGRADVFRISTNGRDSTFGLEKIDEWLKGRDWDVIHFNWGLWDLCYRNPDSKNQGHRDKIHGKLTTTLDQYRQNIKKIVDKLKKTDAVLIWCNTTPVPEHEAGRKAGDELNYNAVAAEIMKKNKIAINDLHDYAAKRLPGIQKKNGDVHYTAKGYLYLARKVAAEIEQSLPAQYNGKITK